jgi:glutathione S-transferase
LSDFQLFIGNKNYSSWSFRPWIGLKQAGIPFWEELVPFDFKNGNPAFASFSPTMKVPILKDGSLTVWETLAILEYAADVFPDAGLWPGDVGLRAQARAISAEMHAGFGALRSACPMNMRRKPGRIVIDEKVRADIDRITAIRRDCLDRSGGPYLYGPFTIADAMYAPVISRFGTYLLSDDPAVAAYSAAMTSLPVWIEWQEAAAQEPRVVEEEEV